MNTWEHPAIATQPYECQTIVPLPENDTLAWIAEEADDEPRRCLDSHI